MAVRKCRGNPNPQPHPNSSPNRSRKPKPKPNPNIDIEATNQYNFLQQICGRLLFRSLFKCFNQWRSLNLESWILNLESWILNLESFQSMEEPSSLTWTLTLTLTLDPNSNHNSNHNPNPKPNPRCRLSGSKAKRESFQLRRALLRFWRYFVTLTMSSTLTLTPILTSISTLIFITNPKPHLVLCTVFFHCLSGHGVISASRCHHNPQP